MDKKFCLLIFALLVIFTVFAGCTGVSNLHSSWSYTLDIKTDGPIENATIIIPLPVLNGTLVIGDVILTPDDFAKGNVTAEFTRNPPGLDFMGAGDLGYEPCFVVLHADMLVPEEGEYIPPVYRMSNGAWMDITDPNDFIDTLNPVGNISMIVPKYNFKWVQPQIKKTGEWRIVYNNQHVSHTIPVFADYQADPSTEVSISMSFRSRNEWEEGYDAWVGNLIWESSTKQFTGSQNGWFMTGCDLYFDGSAFPNLETPEWQKRIGNSSKG
ncbi:MAG: hypothetical protein JW931_03680 [Methanomicrobiaceae archaeon]|nr:hypothetical protein [Methanomicrobiaceae archaeon]